MIIDFNFRLLLRSVADDSSATEDPEDHDSDGSAVLHGGDADAIAPFDDANGEGAGNGASDTFAARGERTGSGSDSDGTCCWTPIRWPFIRDFCEMHE